MKFKYINDYVSESYTNFHWVQNELDNKTPFEILSVDTNASLGFIKNVYRNLAKTYHPDINNSDDTKFKQIVLAYEVLTDPKYSAIKRIYLENVKFKYNDSNIKIDFNFYKKLYSDIIINDIPNLYTNPKEAFNLLFGFYMDSKFSNLETNNLEIDEFIIKLFDWIKLFLESIKKIEHDKTLFLKEDKVYIERTKWIDDITWYKLSKHIISNRVYLIVNIENFENKDNLLLLYTVLKGVYKAEFIKEMSDKGTLYFKLKY